MLFFTHQYSHFQDLQELHCILLSSVFPLDSKVGGALSTAQQGTDEGEYSNRVRFLPALRSPTGHI